MKKKVFFASLLLAASPYVYGQVPPSGDNERLGAPVSKKSTAPTPTQQPAVETPQSSASTSTRFSSAKTITGLVTDDRLEAVVGASVVIKGTTIGTTTDINGEYKLNVPEDATLVFSFAGLITQTVPVNGRAARINVRMERGRPQLSGKVSSEKNPWIAGGLSLLLPGGGQYYNGQYLKGAIMTGVALGCVIVIGSGALEDEYSYDYYGYGGNEEPENYSWVLGLVIFADYAWSIADAYICANRINSGYYTWNVGKKSTLTLRPEMQWASTFGKNYSILPTYGASLKLKF
jgi:hypothetical protein